MNEKITASDESVFFWILTLYDKVVNISKHFSMFTEFDIDEVQGRTIDELWQMLKLDSIVNCRENSHKNEYLLYTKSGIVKVVAVFQEETSTNQVMYIVREKSEFTFEAKYPFIGQVLEDNILGVAVFKVPEIILVKANQKFLDIFEEPFNSPEASIGKFLGDIVTGWSGSTSEKIWRGLIKTQKYIAFDEYKYDRFKKGETYYNSSLIPIFEDGELKYYVEIISDITEKVLTRRKIEEQNRIIKEQNQKLEAIIENISDHILIVYENGEFSRLSKAAKECTPVDINDNIQEWYNYGKYTDENGQELSIENMPVSRIARGEAIKDLYLTLEDGRDSTHMIINGTPIFSENGEFQYGILCFNDVTEYVKKQKELNRQRDIFYKITSDLDMPILTISYPELNIIGYNKKLYEKFVKMASITKMNISKLNIGESLFDLVPNLRKHEVYRKIEEAVESKNTVYLDRMEGIQNGERKITKLAIQPIIEANGEIKEIIISAYDITNIVEEKEAIEQHLKMQEEFFSFISHEFKTPLSVISAAIQVMELSCKKEECHLGNCMLHKIKRSTLQQVRLVNNLLDIIRADSGYLKLHKKNMNIVEVTELIINSVELYANEKGVKIDFFAVDDSIITSIDDEKYERILLNLLSNAIKFTPEGKNIYVDLFREDERLYIEVKDEGIGIPKEKQEVIFSRYEQSENGYTRNTSGTGIGLSLVKLLVEAMGGEIGLESEENKGTSFRVMLPLECIEEEERNESGYDLMGNRLIELRNIEFSNIYLD